MTIPPLRISSDAELPATGALLPRISPVLGNIRWGSGDEAAGGEEQTTASPYSGVASARGPLPPVYRPMPAAMMLVTTTDVIVTVEKPAMIILGRMFPSIAATSSGVSPAPLAASWLRIMVPGNP